MIVVNTSSRFGERVIIEEEQVILSWEADSVDVLRKVFLHTFYFILFYRGSGSREDLRSSEGISSLLPDLNFFIIFLSFRPELDWENEGSSRVWVNFRLID